MEEGSLLQEALARENSLENALVVDVFLLPLPLPPTTSSSSVDDDDDGAGRIGHLVRLAALAVELNRFLQQSQGGDDDDDSCDAYPWLYGGDGPVFGVHVSSSTASSASSTTASEMRTIPHLRCKCRYGVSVADEWKLVALVMEFSASYNDTHDSDNILAIECWDLDDGQILLIEGADVLPSWVDRIGPIACRHRCWILSGGQVHLIEPPLPSSCNNNNNINSKARDDLSLHEALMLIEARSPLVRPCADVTAVVRETLRRRRVTTSVHPEPEQKPGSGGRSSKESNNGGKAGRHHHRGAIAVPRSVARLLRRRPDLAAAACSAFVENAPQHGRLWKQKQQPPKNSDTNERTSTDPHHEPLVGTCEDWVWTTHDFGRIHYVMLRSFAAAPDWKTEDAIPPVYGRSIEVKRLRRQCATEATPHLRHGVQLGVRLAAGLDYLMMLEQQQTEKEHHQQQQSTTASHVERRVLGYWTRIDRDCGGGGGKGSGSSGGGGEWLAQAWEAGPNHARHSLESVMQCPVYEEEVSNCDTPLSHPHETLAGQIRKELLRKCTSDDSSNTNGCIIPGPDDVDSEEWMTMPDEEELRRVTSPVEVGVPSPAPPNPDDDGGSGADDGSRVLDQMLGGVHSFMKGQSAVEGVATRTSVPINNNESRQQQEEVQIINPTAFLNILHATLKAKTADELVFTSTAPAAATGSGGAESDLFFSEQDYEMEGADDDDDSDSDSDSEQDQEMTDLMTAMDQELRQSSQSNSRALDDPEGFAAAAASSSPNDDDDVAESTHLLSNLLQSLDAGSAGASGPVQTLLKEIGIDPPENLPPPPEEDEEEEQET